MITRAELEAKYGAEKILALATRPWPAEYTEDDEQAAIAANIDNAIYNATNIIKSYVGDRYDVVNLSVFPDSLKEHCQKLSFFNLAVDQNEQRLEDEAYARMERSAIAWLKDVSAGRAVIPELVTKQEISVSHVRVHTDGEQRFSKTNFEVY